MGCGVSRSLPASLEAAPIAPEQKRAVKTKAKRIDPGMEHYFRANGLRERGCTAAAIDEYTLALHINPSFATAYYERGLAHHKLGEWECAETDFSLAVKNKRDYAAAFCARAAVEMDLGWFTNVIDDCTHAIRINPDDGSAYTLRGKAYLAVGDADRGLDDLEKGGLLDSKRLCVVCMEHARGARLHPCMHSAMCTTCSKSFYSNGLPCPLCNTCIDNLEFGSFEQTYAFDADFAAKHGEGRSPLPQCDRKQELITAENR